MRSVRLSWVMSEDGVAEVYASDADKRTFPLLDIFRTPLISKGGMTRAEAKAFQAFAAERICAAWNTDMDAADVAEGHKIDPNLTLTEWGRGHNAACDQIANEIRRRFQF